MGQFIFVVLVALVYFIIPESWGFLKSISFLLLFLSLLFSVYDNPITRRNQALEEEKASDLEKDLRVKREENNRERDADWQDAPYRYEIGRHGNETLAIRYGIVNAATNGSAKKSIRVVKTRKLQKDFYEVLLVDFGSREAVAVIERGTDYIKTFYPLGWPDDQTWFEDNRTLEMLLKDNSGLPLVEMAKFHIGEKLKKISDG